MLSHANAPNPSTVVRPVKRAAHILRGSLAHLARAITREKAPMLTIKITPNDKGNPPGKLADAELLFTDGPLDGLKLVGFAVWERRTGNGRNVTFPARQYAINGERRSFALLRPVVDSAAQYRIRDLILDAYAAYETETAGVR